MLSWRMVRKAGILFISPVCKAIIAFYGMIIDVRQFPTDRFVLAVD